MPPDRDIILGIEVKSGLKFASMKIVFASFTCTGHERLVWDRMRVLALA
jgi:hypothetical protein